MPTYNPIPVNPPQTFNIDSGICTTIPAGQVVTTAVIDIPGSTFTITKVAKYMVTVGIYSQGNVQASDLILDLVDASNVAVPRSKIRVVTKVANLSSFACVTFTLDNPIANASYKLRGNCGNGSHAINNGALAASNITWFQLTNIAGA